MVKGCLGLSDHEMIELLVLCAVRRKICKNATVDLRRADFGQLKTLCQETISEGKVVQEG